jgi:putative membrane-bound dehydrogenase-like protein
MRRSAILRSVLAFTAVAATTLGVGGERAGSASAAEFALNGRTFTLPDGFTIEQAAGPPLVDRPIVADFDEEGRLYVADSSGSNDPVKTQLEKKPHRIVRLEDTNGDGRFDSQTVFADKMMFPEGAMWFDGSLYVSAPPSIWKLTDTNGDGVADKRVEWFQGKTLTGCANDLHGPYLGLDGWIYWCKGAFAEQTYPRPGKTPFVTTASHIFRCRPDGSGIEPVMTGGMDNPVDVVFTPGGERIFTTTFLQNPGGGKRDGLIHAAYGGVYGKVHKVIDGHVRTGPDVMPVLVHLGPAAPCGLTTFESNAFGPAFRDNLFACNFNLQKVTRHALTPLGATFASSAEDFLVSNHHDFHPTDVIEDADGSLLVVDTGGWYKLCCPTSQLHKPDVLGAVYRVRRAGAAVVDDPRGLKLSWRTLTPKALTGLFDDPLPAGRRRAIHALGKKGSEAVPSVAEAVAKGKTAETRRNAVWAATRIDGDDARAASRPAIADPDESVRQAAIHSASVRLDEQALPKLLAVLAGPSHQNRRAAAEALGRLGDSSAIPALLTAAGEPGDRFLEHSLTYALIEIANPTATAAGLASENARTHRAALVALDQMVGGKLDPEAVARDLAAAAPSTREIATWIVGRHPAWAPALAGFLKARLAEKTLSKSDGAELAGLLARFAREKAVQDLLTETLRDVKAPRESRTIALRAIGQSGLKDVPKAWVEGLASILATERPALGAEAVATTRALPLTFNHAPKLAEALLAIAGDSTAPVVERLDALAALPAGLAALPPGLFALLKDELAPEKPAGLRTSAANILARTKLDSEQLIALADAVKTAGPLEMDRLLTAFEQSKDDAVGRKLVAVLKDAPALAYLRVEILKPRLDKFGERVRQQAESIYATLNVDAAKQKARLEEMLPTLTGGDVRRGQEVFLGAKTACRTCHAVGYVGGNVGPDLTSIGKIRTDRDLLESILYPSLSFVRSYEPVTVATRDGKVVNGLLRSDSSDEVVLAVNATEVARVPRDDIEEMRPGAVSVMPAGLEQQITRQELADLLSFLKSRK